MTSEEIRQKFLSFFKEKGHTVVSSSSLIPDDPSVLLTTAGMQQFKKYFTGELDAEKNFGAARATSIQKCFRTSDIEEVGDKTHLTFFEMLGHFSFGDYFKKETIAWTYELLTQIFQISPDRISATVFDGDGAVPFDKESFNAWLQFLPKERIRRGVRRDNFWGPAGTEGPCGAANEVYVDNVEVATLVFMEYYCNPDQTLKSLPKKGVDVGWGFERLVSMLQGLDDVFETDVLHPLISKVRETKDGLDIKIQRVLADHLRASIFLIADGVRPSNKEAGYILRRLLRRILAYQVKYDIHSDLFPKAASAVAEKFGVFYPEVGNAKEILAVMEEERQKFQKAIGRGLKAFERRLSDKAISGAEAFYLYETFGLPFELIKELAPPEAVKNLRKVDFESEFEKHKETSRIGSEKKFGGHGLILDTGELKASNEEELKKVVRLHTATHLMQQALREVLGSEVH
ncbi:MAG: alanine--tRNA ligase, partial [Parcubacteria group bacterium]|nr:alanine--tRNA ligase [Parcubacteria group bacterium]